MDVKRVDVDELWAKVQAEIQAGKLVGQKFAHNHYRNMRDKITELAVGAQTLILFGKGRFESSKPAYVQRHTAWYGGRFRYKLPHAIAARGDDFSVDPNRDRNFYWAMTQLNEHEMKLSRRKKPTAKPTILEAKVSARSAFIVDCKIRVQGSPDPNFTPDLILRLGIAAPSPKTYKGICKTSIICNLSDEMTLVGRAGKNRGKSLREMVGFPILNEQEIIQQVIETVANLGE